MIAFSSFYFFLVYAKVMFGKNFLKPQEPSNLEEIQKYVLTYYIYPQCG
jgi:hypothetical protein